MAAPRSSRTSPRTTWAPSSAKRRASSAPCPRAAPVMMATEPERSIMCAPLFARTAGKPRQRWIGLDAQCIVEERDHQVLTDHDWDLDELDVVVVRAQGRPRVVADVGARMQLVDGAQEGSIASTPPGIRSLDDALDLVRRHPQLLGDGLVLGPHELAVREPRDAQHEELAVAFRQAAVEQRATELVPGAEQLGMANEGLEEVLALRRPVGEPGHLNERPRLLVPLGFWDGRNARGHRSPSVRVPYPRRNDDVGDRIAS